MPIFPLTLLPQGLLLPSIHKMYFVMTELNLLKMEIQLQIPWRLILVSVHYIIQIISLLVKGIKLVAFTLTPRSRKSCIFKLGPQMDLDSNRAPRLRSSVSARSRAEGLVQDLLAANMLIQFRDLTHLQYLKEKC